jgi:hypothetical protein
VLADEMGAITLADTARLPAGLRWPSYRFLYTIYRVRGETTTVAGEPRPGLRVVSLEPAITIRGEAIDSLGLGAWEGTVSRRTGPNTFSHDDRLRVRMTFDGVEPNAHVATLPVWDELTVLLPTPEASLFRTTGVIANWNERITAADGTCLEALATLGEASPFYGTTNASVALYRYPFMHGPGDHVTVFDYPLGAMDLSENGMGGIYFNHPAALIQDGPREPWGEWFAIPHATPNGHSIEDMVAVEGGGAPCR